MVESVIDKILNIIIPPAVFLFIFFIIYRIPIVKEGIDRLIDWNKNRQHNKEDRGFELSSIQTVTYE